MKRGNQEHKVEHSLTQRDQIHLFLASSLPGFLISSFKRKAAVHRTARFPVASGRPLHPAMLARQQPCAHPNAFAPEIRTHFEMRSHSSYRVGSVPEPASKPPGLADIHARTCMLTYVRTTIILDDHLAREAEQLAASRGITLSDLVNHALRAALVPRGAPVPRFEMVTFGEGLPETHHEPADLAAALERDHRPETEE